MSSNRRMESFHKSSYSSSGPHDVPKSDQGAVKQPNLNSIRKNKSLDASSRNSLFWNGVQSLMKVHKHDKFDAIKLKADGVETGISVTNHKVSSCHKYMNHSQTQINILIFIPIIDVD